jgi:hypothetical protein
MSSVRWCLALICVAALEFAASAGPGANAMAARSLDSATVAVTLRPPSPAIHACLPNALAQATIEQGPAFDTLTIQADGLPPFSGFDLFATALPHAPYGPSWLLSQLQADGQGRANTRVQAILFDAFRVADADGSGAQAPTTHLVLFFDRASDADHCFQSYAAPTTRFTNGRQAGPAVLASIDYADNAGPLSGRPFPQPGLGISTPGGGHRAQGAPVIFTSSCNDPAGWTAIRFIDFRLTKDGKTAFWARLDRQAGRMYLRDSASGAWQGGDKPGSAVILTSPTAQLQLAGSSVIGTVGTTGKVVWQVSFSKSAVGQTFQQSVQVTDMRNQTRGWNPSGTWTVDH